ncbi:response regulator transcription factor [Haloglycomyces albus]|uniref:winged helix-turn-helix domain-containing protein n=1 Tax=Haloglycomyces albus TaxID=526067 RepID=UPI00046C8D27|nr:response regulator transcription factor [Haloglycomyces albus]
MEILVLTGYPVPQFPENILPAITLLPHNVRYEPRDARSLLDGPSPDLIAVDARDDLADARSTCRMLRTTGVSVPVFLIIGESGLITLQADWKVDDFLLSGAGPAEVEARLRLAVGREDSRKLENSRMVKIGDLTIDPDMYAVKIKGSPIDLTYKEFELLRYLSEHPGRVFSREQLLREVWGYDYFGGTRTVDVHIRRLRAKLGAEHESLIGTVRQVGYRFVLPPSARDKRTSPAPDITPMEV